MSKRIVVLAVFAFQQILFAFPLANAASSKTISANTAIDSLPENKNTKEAQVEENTSTPERRIADTINSHSLGVGLGETFLMGKFANHGRDKITADLFYNYSASYSFDFLANLHYSKHSYRQDEVYLPGLAVAIKGKVYQYDAFSPYVLGGVGFYRPQVTRAVDGRQQRSEAQIVFGYNLGAGLDLRLNERVTVGLLLHYHNPFDVKPDAGERVEGSYAKLMFTAMYTF